VNSPHCLDGFDALVIEQTSDRLDWITTAVLLAWMAVVRVGA
jgi:hypothetical protein